MPVSWCAFDLQVAFSCYGLTSVIPASFTGCLSVAATGFFPLRRKQKPDFVCLQETKAQEHQPPSSAWHPDGYHSYSHDAVRKGYSGVARY